MELAALLSLAQAVGIISLLVILPVLQGWGVGRRAFIIVALVLCVFQWLAMASMSVSAVKHLLPTVLFNAIPYAIQVIGLMMGPFMPCIRSSIASLAESEMRGVASVAVSLGAIAALQTVVSFIAPLVASPIYAATESRAPGTVFVLMSGLAGAAACVAYTLPNLEMIATAGVVTGGGGMESDRDAAGRRRSSAGRTAAIADALTSETKPLLQAARQKGPGELERGKRIQ